MRKVPYFIVSSFIALLGAAFGPNAAAQAGSPAPQAQQQSPVNNIAKAAVQQGVLACAGRINQVSNFLGFGGDAGALLMVPPNSQDQRLLSLAMELPTPAGPAYAGAAFAPNQANGCGASYEAVVYWPQACDAVANKQFGTLKKVGFLKKTIAVLDGGIATKVFLMPAGAGCVSIKQEAVL